MLPNNWPSLVYGIRWGAAANSNTGGDPGWYDMSSRTTRGGWTCRRGIQYELGRAEAGELTIPLDNTDGALDPDNTGSTYAPNVLPYRPVQLWAYLPANMLDWPTSSFEPISQASGLWSIWVNVDPGFGISFYSSSNTSGILGLYMGEFTTLAAGTASIEMDASKRVPVTAGTTYTAAANCWPNTTSGRQARIAIRWYNTAGTVISTSSGSVVNLPNNVGTVPATQVTANGAAPAGAVLAAVQVTYLGATAAGEQMGVDQVTLSIGTTPSTVYTVWGGATERFPQVWEDEQGKVDLTCIGPVAFAAKIGMSSAVVDQIEVNTPSFLYPLNDASGSLLAGGIGTASPPPMTIFSAAAGSGTVTFGSTSTPLGSEDTTLYLTSPAAGSSGNTSAGSCLKGMPNLINGTSSLTYGIFFQTSSANPAGATLFYAQGPNSYVWLYVNGGNGYLTLQTPAGSTVINTNFADGKWHFAAVTYNGTSGAWYLYGDSNSTFLSPAFTPAAGPYTGYVGGQVSSTAGNPNGMAYGWNGNLCCFFGASTNLSTGALATISQVGLTALAGKAEGDLSRSLATMAGYTRPVNGDAGASPMQGTLGIKGKTLLQVWQKIADDAGAVLCEYGDGTVHVQTRRNRQQTTTSAFTFGESTAAGEIPYLPSVQFDFDPTFVLNVISVEQLNGVNVVAQDPTSISSYFPAQKDYSGSLLQSGAECTDQANYLLALYKDPHTRLSRLVFRPSALSATTVPNAWKAALSLEVGSRVTVKRRPLGGGPVKSGDFYVESITHRVFHTPGEWETELLLSPIVWSNVWVLGDTTASVLDSTTRLAW